MNTDWKALGDDELALALKAGESAAFDELVARHQGRVYAVAYRFTSNREDALDVAQDALIKAFRRIDAWQPHGGFVPWLMRLTVNQAIDHLRRRRRRAHGSFDERMGRGDADAQPTALDTEQRVRANEIDHAVQAVLGALSPMQRSVFVLRHYEGMQLTDIAEAVNCSVGSVKVHLFRAVRKVRAELGDRTRF